MFCLSVAKSFNLYLYLQVLDLQIVWLLFYRHIMCHFVIQGCGSGKKTTRNPTVTLSIKFKANNIQI